MNSRALWRGELIGALVGLLLLLWVPSFAQAASVKEFLIVTGEWNWKARPGEAAVMDRNRGAVKEIERYTFDPAFLVVNKGRTGATQAYI